MIHDLERITSEAMSLPPAMRAVLAEKLFDSLGESDRAELEKAWLEEAERRCREIDNGQVELLPGPAVLQALRERAQ